MNGDQAAYTAWLRGRSDGELRALVAARPDLITPIPADLSMLAVRATTVAALARVLDGLDRYALRVLEALLALPGPATFDELLAAIGGGPGGAAEPVLRAAIDRLTLLAVVWGGPDELRVVPALHELVPHPAGLGPPAAELFAACPEARLRDLLADLDGAGSAGAGDALAVARAAARVAGRLADPDRIAALLEDVGPDARAALDRLAWGPPVGTVEAASRPVRRATARSPVERLLARGLLVAVDDRTVVLPREVALWLRGGRLFPEPPAGPPDLTAARRETAVVDRTAGAAALAAVRTVEALCEHWTLDPPPVLRGGGLGVRESKRLAQRLDVADWVAVLYAETAYAAGLVAPGGGVDSRWLPTARYDVWRGRDLAARWVELAAAWLSGDRVPALAGTRDERDRVINALGPDLVRGSAPRLRALVVEVLAAAPPGCAPSADQVGGWLDWHRPRRRSRLRELMTGATLREAEQLGVTGHGALAGHGRALAGGDLEAAMTRLTPALPELVDHILLQADLTAIAPGPLVQELAEVLAVAADVESTGGATVYRFGERSVRRALDAGFSAAELVDFLARHSRTPLPQPLRYLVDDVARRHGRLRVGTASAYLRCDDPVVLEQLLADRRAVSLRLHRLAPTVLASRTPVTGLLESLRELGYAPVAEGPDGAVVIAAAEVRRAPVRADAGAGPVREPSGPGEEVVAAAVRALRAGDEAATAPRRPIPAPADIPRSPVAGTLAALAEAVAGGGRVWIGYLDSHGRASSRIVEPVRVEGGYLTAFDATRAAIHRFAVHRITGVAALDPDDPAGRAGDDTSPSRKRGIA